MKIQSLLFASLFILSFTACGGGEETNKDNPTTNDAPDTEEQANVPADSPCELLDESDVRALFGVDASIEITIEDKDYTYPTCKYEWKDKKVQMTTKVGSMEVTTDLPSEIMLVMVNNVNEKMFDRSVSVYKDGVEVKGLGEKAMWGEKIAQLSVMKGGMMYHIHVKADNDDSINKENAIAIAKKIL
jgi:hypothetical protein